MKPQYKTELISKTNIICMVISIILVAVLCVMFFFYKQKQKATIKYYESIYSEQMAGQVAADAERNEALNGSVYQKLAYGLEANILVIGDSIGRGSGADTVDGTYYNLLSADLLNTYKSKINVTSIAVNNSSSYAGYVNTMQLDERNKFDLAIICYGQNDSEKNLSVYYESIIRAVSEKFPKCQIISVLESSQKEYTSKIKTIQKLCDHYSIPTADTISAFKENYDNLVISDKLIPNKEGNKIYADTIKAVIKAEVDKKSPLISYDIEPLNSDVENYKNFKYIKKSEFTKKGNHFKVNTDISGILGIDYKLVNGNNKVEIYVDGKPFSNSQTKFTGNSDQQKIVRVDDNCTVKNSIEVRFETSQQAEGFEGLIFSWK